MKRKNLTRANEIDEELKRYSFLLNTIKLKTPNVYQRYIIVKGVKDRPNVTIVGFESGFEFTHISDPKLFEKLEPVLKEYCKSIISELNKELKGL